MGALEQHELAERLEGVRHRIRVVGLAIDGLRERKNLAVGIGSISVFVEAIEDELSALGAKFEIVESKKVASVTKLPTARLPANHS